MGDSMDLGILSAMIVLGGLGLIFGIGLAISSQIFAVQRDQRVALIEEILPGANCGACGAPGCMGFAEGVVQARYPVTGCTAGGAEVAEKIAEIMGTQVGEVVSVVAVVQCQGDRDHAVNRAAYAGIMDCRAAVLIDNGAKACDYGCLGLGTCAVSCPFDAITMNSKGLPVVDEDLCTGCGECVKACPRGIMTLVPREQKVYLACVSQGFGKAVKAVCDVGCIGCTLCANPKTIDNEIITMNDKLPVIHYEKVTHPLIDLQNAVDKCPAKCFLVRGESEPDEKKSQNPS
jgi:electron transport complex protein RnfB